MEGMTKLADISENQMIDPFILPLLESSPLTSRVNQAELNRLESSIAGDLADMRTESEADGTVSKDYGVEDRITWARVWYA